MWGGGVDVVSNKCMMIKANVHYYHMLILLLLLLQGLERFRITMHEQVNS
jgi:hypothetical protein